MRQIIVDAIAKKRYITFTYKQLPRVVQPHAYGLFSNAVDMLVAWQTDGLRDKGELPGWGQYHPDDMHALSLSDETFPSPHSQYNPNDKRFLRVYAKL